MTSSQTADRSSPDAEVELTRSITGRLLFFYVLGDVLGSGIYVLIGSVAGEVGGAFWIAFAVGVSVAAITGLAYAELATKYPKAAGAALYLYKAFGNRPLAFLVTVSFLSASFAAAGSLSVGFARYFLELWDVPPALLVALLFLLVLTIINFIGITESVVVNMVMTIVELSGLVIVVGIGIWFVAQGDADFGRITEFETTTTPIFAIIAGVALAFFAMTGFENVANVAEETVDPQRSFPRALIGGMVAAGVIYVLVAITASLVVGAKDLAASDAALLEVVKADIIPVPLGFMTTLFAIIACIAITNTTLVAVVTQPRILYGMAREDVVPGVFAKLHPGRRSPWVGLIFSALVVAALLVIGTLVVEAGGGIDLIARLATVTVVLLLFIYFLVILAALKLSGQDVTDQTFRAPRPLLYVGLVGNIVLLGYVVVDDPTSVVWCAGLLAIGGVLFLLEHFFGRRNRPPTAAPGDPTTTTTTGAEGA
ncbi:amino acid/polyamine/organocation transporter (APC superfamily) [Nocardioides sp. J9]|uniref:APC family permease n=1 Tax=Nocardioides sp. J9 TaxID=935844 RepID=UPI0011A8446B|nr:APC family permease [Nocardioides sp. J9]TWG91522.1 amino acid/polyamine/organocation transporter (APC superfamily) [Nocardioides sp. J9]